MKETIKKEKTIRERKNQKIIIKILSMLMIMFGVLLLKNQAVFAETSAYYFGSQNATRPSGYEPAKDTEGNNVEVTLDMTQRLDKMLYYILTYDEVENQTYVGNQEEAKINEKKQSALYYLIYNYRQQTEEYAKLTTNEKLKEILITYTGTGNSLSDFDSVNKNGAQIIFAQAMAWSKGESSANEALKLKQQYQSLSNANIQYWATNQESPQEGAIYNPPADQTTLIFTVYQPKEDVRIAQNAIKVIDQEIIQEKLEILRNAIQNSVTTDFVTTFSSTTVPTQQTSLEDMANDGEAIKNSAQTMRDNIYQ